MFALKGKEILITKNIGSLITKFYGLTTEDGQI